MIKDGWLHVSLNAIQFLLLYKWTEDTEVFQISPNQITSSESKIQNQHRREIDRNRMKQQHSLLLLSVLFSILVQGNCEKCDVWSVQIQQATVGKSADMLDIVIEVEVKNLCSCAIKNVFVNTNGFTSSVMVDPKVFRRESSSYLVNDGGAIASQSSVKFRYAWDHYFQMTPASLQATC